MNTFIRRVAVRSSFMVPTRQLQTTTVRTRDIGSSAKLVGAGTCTVGIAGSGAGYRSLLGSLIIRYPRNPSRYYSSGPDKKPTNDNGNEPRNKGQVMNKPVDEYLIVRGDYEDSKQRYKVKLQEMSKEEVIEYYSEIVGGLRKDLVLAHKKLMVLAVRSRIEDLSKQLLWPKSVKKPPRRRDIFTEILTSKDKKFTSHPNVLEFRKLFRASGFSLEFFLDTMDDIYGEFSDRAAHNIPLPEVVTIEYIEEMFRHLGLVPDRNRILAVDLILRPLPFTPQEKSDEEEDD